LFAFGPDFMGGYSTDVEPAPDIMRIREWRPGLGWADVGTYPRPAPGPVTVDGIRCGPGAAAYVAQGPWPVGVSRDLHWFTPNDATWHAVPDLAPAGLVVSIQVATVHGVDVLGLDDRLFTLAPGARAWTARGNVPLGHSWQLSGRLLVGYDDDETHDGLTLRLVDVDALPSVDQAV
jgi:hypothetical protein